MGHSHHGHHSHDHDHHHGHGHGHHHAPKNFNNAFLIGIAVNFSFVLIEALYGYFSNSLSLMADAGHNLSDVAGLGLAWGAALLAKKKPAGRFTYGLRSSSILASLANAVLLLAAIAGITWGAVERLITPAPAVGSTIIVVAAIGVVINTATALLFVSGRKDDLNIRGAYLHMAADALVSLGVVIAGVLILYTGWLWLDPVVSLVIALVIFISTWELLRESFMLASAAVPVGLDLEEIKEALIHLEEVRSVHDLHVWAMSTTETALTAHLEMTAGHPGDHFLHDVSAMLTEKFNIQHSTLQIELGDTDHDCHLDSDDV